MCGVDSDLDDGGVGDDERDQEDEFAMAEGVRMLPPPTAHCEGSVWGGRRSRCGCLVFGVGLVLWNLGLAVTCVLLLATVFALVLLPAALLLYAGFLCHSRVRHSLCFQNDIRFTCLTNLSTTDRNIVNTETK